MYIYIVATSEWQLKPSQRDRKGDTAQKFRNKSSLSDLSRAGSTGSPAPHQWQPVEWSASTNELEAPPPSVADK